jgi:hypothetical protein
METLIENHVHNNTQVILGYLGAKTYEEENSVPNAWMASSAGHPFWLYCLSFLVTSQQVKGSTPQVESVAGPHLLYHAIRLYQSAMQIRLNEADVTRKAGDDTMIYDIVILKAGLIYPFDWHDSSMYGVCLARIRDDQLQSASDYEICKGNFPNAYVINYWAHSWAV